MSKKYHWLVTVMIIYYAVFSESGTALARAGNGAYLLTAAGAVLSYFVHTSLWKGVPGVFAQCLPRRIRLIAGIILIVSLTLQAVAICAGSAASISRVFMRLSPFAYLLVFFIIPGISAGFTGLKTVGRYACVGGTGIVIMVFLISIFALRDFSVKNLYPIAGSLFSSAGNIFTGTALYTNIFYLYVINGKASKKDAAKVLLISGSVYTAICLACSLITPYEAMSSVGDPLLYAASMVDLSFLMERSEGQVLLIRLFASFICTGALFGIMGQVLTRAFSLKDSKAAVWIFALIVTSGALLANRPGVIELIAKFSVIWTSCISVLIPMLLRFSHSKEEV